MPTPLATSSTPIFVKIPSENYRSRACRRFGKALVIGVLIYLLAAAYFGSLTWGRKLKGGDWEYWGDIDPEWPEYTGARGNWEIASDGCTASWDDAHDLIPPKVILFPFPDIDINLPDTIDINAPYHAHTSFSLSPDAVKHLLVGNRAYGNIEFTTSSSKEQKDIKVDVTAHYYRQSVLEKVRACKLQGKEGGEGVGIYLPLRKGTVHREDQVNFKILITFPSPGKKPLYINSFETHFTISSHLVRDLRGKVHFQDLRLRSSNARLESEGIEADRADLKTSNGAIRGTYWVNDSLVLETSNGKIDVDLKFDDEGYKADGVNAVLRTSNAAIDARSNLFSSSSSLKGGEASGGRFSLDVRTSNGPVTLNVPTIPWDSTLKLTGRSSNAPVNTYLDEKGSFEGNFRLETSSYMGLPNLERADSGNGERDGMRRILEKTLGGRGSLLGKVYWGKWGKGRNGNVELRTSNAKIFLSI